MKMARGELLPEDLEFVFAQTQGLWDELAGARLFVTGGTGFFGKWMTGTFLNANKRLNLGAKMTLLVRDPQKLMAQVPMVAQSPDIEIIQGDLLKFAFPKEGFSHILHMSVESFSTQNPADAVNQYLVNFCATQKILEFCSRLHPKKLLFTSSGAVYGPQPPTLAALDENWPLDIKVENPGSAYAIEKLSSEYLCTQFGSALGFEAKLARCFAFVGPHLPLDSGFAAGNFVRDAHRGNKIVVSGDGTAVRSYLYAAELAVWLWTILLKGAHGRPYNVGSGVEVTVGELARKTAALSGTGVEILGKPTPGRSAGRYVPSVKRAENELGLAQTIPLDDALKRTLKWLNTQGD